jgi:hypothetical protein
MSSLKDMPPEAKSRESRRGRRVNSRVPVALEWEGESATRLREEGHTRVVNCYGCLAVVPCNLSLDKRVRLTNLATQNSIVAVVVWKGKERTEGWELGLELVDPQMDFWGLEL